MNKYQKLKEIQQEKINKFPMIFAFSNEQFEKGMKKLGLEISDTDKIYSIGNGGYIKKSDSKAFKEMFEKFDEELSREINEDPTGENFVYDMFLYELENHEYGYTQDYTDTLETLGITIEQIKNNFKLSTGFIKAIETIN